MFRRINHLEPQEELTEGGRVRSRVRHVSYLTLVMLLLAGPGWALATQGSDFLGIEPLSERTTNYEGIGEPGLYPNGLNRASGAHRDYGEQKTSEITPRDSTGAADPDGWIGFIAIGMVAYGVIMLM